MDLNQIPLMHAIVRKMDWLTQKQQVLSDNIANADTPGFKAHTLEKPDFRALLKTLGGESGGGSVMLQPRTTNPKHIGTPDAAGQQRVKEVKEESSDTAPNGNNVVLEEQMMDLTNTQMEYGMLVNLYKKHINILRTTLGRQSR